MCRAKHKTPSASSSSSTSSCSSASASAAARAKSASQPTGEGNELAKSDNLFYTKLPLRIVLNVCIVALVLNHISCDGSLDEQTSIELTRVSPPKTATSKQTQLASQNQSKAQSNLPYSQPADRATDGSPGHRQQVGATRLRLEKQPGNRTTAAAWRPPLEPASLGSQWIPIGPQAGLGPPEPAARGAPRARPAPLALAGAESRHREHHFRQRHAPRPPAPAHRDGPRWRRPRYRPAEEFELSASRHYKRVLLCDKTLVSLDYVRGLSLEPRPFGEYLGDESYELLDNFVELDSELEATVAQLSRRNESGWPAPAASLRLARRSRLTDDDPLVKCDMWDLEKGLKNREPPEAILRMAVKADFDTVRDAINRCRQLSERTAPPEQHFRDGLEVMSTEDLVSLFSIKRGLIPGTKWCGLGDQADSYNDLGPKHRIDICCRAHDHCPIRLKPFRNDYGVLNIALYTKSHCDCDADFYRCLREVRSRTADMLGNLYFNVMKLQCMREQRLKVCREMRPIALGFERCVRYDESARRTMFKFTTPPVAY